MHNSVITFKATELYPLNGWIVWYMIYILIKLLKKKQSKNNNESIVMWPYSGHLENYQKSKVKKVFKNDGSCLLDWNYKFISMLMKHYETYVQFLPKITEILFTIPCKANINTSLGTS